MNNTLVLASFALCCAVVAYFGWAWNSGQRAVYLPGVTTHGHYQIELQCAACHDPWNGATQSSCEGCHSAELELADDSHPKSKFTDPRNADRVAKLDARECITCHVEHRPELTGSMGLTQPDDYCFLCHSDIAQERPSHEGLAFETCHDAGCHNFHDNRGLHEDYLEQHLGEAAVLANSVAAFGAIRREPTGERWLRAEDQDAPEEWANAGAIREWAQSAHASGGVNCSGCHTADTDEPLDVAWIENPGHAQCRQCHEGPVEGFETGRHGMRLAHELAPMTPAEARLPMKSKSHAQQLGCSSCHGAHGYDRKQAATDACLGCHDDDHSRAYPDSPHAKLAAAEAAGSAPAGSGVTCATCHLPRVEARGGSGDFVVEHNQNAILRPSSKQIRPVCSSCHGVGFAIDALADRALVRRNFNGQPAAHVRSLDLVQHKLESIKASRGQ